jgi:gamma-glutamylaminecyclotransferase
MAELVCIFVYGSLKRGFRHHQELRGAEYIDETETVPGYRVVQVGEYPALIAGSWGTVRGELYLIAASDLAALDEFEGPGYERRQIELAGGIVANAYFLRNR